MAVYFIPKVTEAGKAAALAATNNGLQLLIDAISFGTGMYDPIGTELALHTEVHRVTVAGGSRIMPTQIRITGLWLPDELEAQVGEIGFWAGGVMFAVWSRADKPLGYKTAGVAFVIVNDVFFDQLPPGSVNVTIDPASSAVFAALAAHETAVDPHPQYAMNTDLDDAMAAHLAALDPHSQYYNQVRYDAAQRQSRARRMYFASGM